MAANREIALSPPPTLIWRHVAISGPLFFKNSLFRTRKLFFCQIFSPPSGAAALPLDDEVASLLDALEVG